MAHLAKRSTFRHGNLAEALIDAAVKRIEADGVESVTLRDLANDTGVNHRAIYRHYPDKDALLAAVAEKSWKDFIKHQRKAIAKQPPGEAMLVAAGLSNYMFAREHPNIFHFVNDARFNLEGRFPAYEASVMEGVQILAIGFAGTGMAPEKVIWSAALYMSALQGVISQILHRRLRIAPQHATVMMTEACTMLVRGFSSPS
jgi:AcrR family transcriptional regulator